MSKSFRVQTILLSGETVQSDGYNGLLINGINLTGSLVPNNLTGQFAPAGMTGQFITTAQTGGFGGGNFNTGTLVGTFALLNGTNYYSGISFSLGNEIISGNISGQTFSGQNFIVSGSTVVIASQTGNFITNGQTGIFASAGLTGNFLYQNYSGQINLLALNDSSGINLSGGSFIITEGIPVVISNYTSGNAFEGARNLCIVDRYAYMTCNPVSWGYGRNSAMSYFNVIDIQNPSSPKVIGSLSTLIISGVESLNVIGNYAYMSLYPNSGFGIVDVSNPSSPQLAGYLTGVTTLAKAQSSDFKGSYAYVTTANSTGPSVIDYLNIIDISNPSNPFVVGVTGTTGLSLASDIQVKGKYAYVCSWYGNVLSTFDVSNPTNPIWIGQSSYIKNPDALYVESKYAYVCAQGTGFWIIDVSNPHSSNMPIVGSVSGSNFWSVTVQNNVAYVNDYLDSKISMYNVSNPANPVLMGSLVDTTNLAHVDILYNCGNHTYCTRSNNGNNCGLTILQNGGISVPGANIGSIYTNECYVGNRLSVGSDIISHTSISSGPLGIYSQGPLSVLGSGKFLSGISISGSLNFSDGSQLITSNFTGNSGLFVNGNPVVTAQIGTSPTSGTITLPITSDIYGSPGVLLAQPAGWLSFIISGGLTGRIPYY